MGAVAVGGELRCTETGIQTLCMWRIRAILEHLPCIFNGHFHFYLLFFQTVIPVSVALSRVLRPFRHNESLHAPVNCVSSAMSNVFSS